VAAHLEDDHREREGDADPEAARHARQFWIRPGIGGHCPGLQGHPADGTCSGCLPHNLRMHGTGVFRRRPTSGRGGCRGLVCMGGCILLGIGAKSLQALRAAEVVRRACVDVASHGVFRRDPHPADGIHHLECTAIGYRRRCCLLRALHYSPLPWSCQPRPHQGAEARHEAQRPFWSYVRVYCAGLLSNFRLHPAEQKT
jgi:hypothetical protein